MRFFLNVLVLSLLFLCIVDCKKRRQNYGNAISEDDITDILEVSEVSFKYSTYALKMPSPVKVRGQHRSNTNFKLDYVSCSSNNVTQELKELRKKTRCKPRDTVVNITAPLGSTVFPNTVVVKRCGGQCVGGKRCISAKKVKTEFYVRSIQEKSKMNFCNRISVPEDVECKCGCQKTKHNQCTPKQKFDSNLCKCVCRNKEEQENCLENSEMHRWHADSCSCQCKYEKPCTTGTTWSKVKCRCVPSSR